MSYTLIAKFILAIALFVSYEPLYDCFSQNDRLRFRDQPESANLIRVKLSGSNEPDPFEAVSRSHDLILDGNGIKVRKPFALNSQLVGVVGIGRPAQEFRFIFDTSRANMWISSLNCINCGNKKRYNSSASTTHIEDGTPIQIGGDSGFLSTDKVLFGDVIIENQTFIEMTTLGDLDVSELYDGLFCLGYDLFSRQDIATPLRQMVKQKLIDHEVFSIYQNSSGGEIVFGGFDEKHIMPWINWLPSEDVAYWSFRMNSLTLKQSAKSKEVTVCRNGCKVAINTLLPYIEGPPEEVMMINDAMGAKVDEDDESLFVLPDCDLSKLPNLVLRINLDDFELSPERYVQKVKKGDKIICTSSLHAVSSEFNNLWSIGSSIVGHIYMVFDYENRALGFAHAK